VNNFGSPESMPKLRALLGFHTRGRKGFGWERKHEVPEKENFLTKGNYYTNFKRLRSRRALPEIGRGTSDVCRQKQNRV